MLDVHRIRGSFRVLGRTINERPLVYLDSAATSLTPEEVLDAEASFYRQYKANVHRGRHALSEEASEAFRSARQDIARFLGAASAEEIVFTANATSAMNIVAEGLDFSPDAEILTTIGEHHSTVLPWRGRYCVKYIDTPPTRPVEPEVLCRSIGKRTKAVVLAQASNVTGLVQPVAKLCSLARQAGILSVIDAAQSAPHIALETQQMGCDFLTLSGHKMLGPTGVGILYGRRDALSRLKPRDYGGGTIEQVSAESFGFRSPPECFESGTPNIAGVLGLAAALRLIEGLGWADIGAHGRALASALREGLAAVPAVRVLAAEGEVLPIASFSIDVPGTTPDDIAIALSDRHGVMVRSGLLCAHPLFEALSWRAGVVRASAYVYNTLHEVQFFCESLAELTSAFRPSHPFSRPLF